MKKLYWLTIILLSVGIVMQTAPLGATATAHDGDDHNESDTSKKIVDSDYQFVVAKGNNLSLIVRRALQLYDAQNNELSLKPAAAMYAETHIVQRLGSGQVDTGERIIVKQDVLREFSQKSAALNSAQLAAWQLYADRADFNVSHISTMQASAARTEHIKEQSSNSQSSDASQSGDDPVQVKQNPFAGAKRLHPVYWVGAISALVAMYYLWDRRRA